MPKALHPVTHAERMAIIEAMAVIDRDTVTEMQLAFRHAISECHPDRAGAQSSEKARILVIARNRWLAIHQPKSEA